jgi:hypothetical protein
MGIRHATPLRQMAEILICCNNAHVDGRPF